MEDNPRVARVLKAIGGLKLEDVKALAAKLAEEHPYVADEIRKAVMAGRSS